MLESILLSFTGGGIISWFLSELFSADNYTIKIAFWIVGAIVLFVSFYSIRLNKEKEVKAMQKQNEDILLEIRSTFIEEMDRNREGLSDLYKALLSEMKKNRSELSALFSDLLEEIKGNADEYMNLTRSCSDNTAHIAKKQLETEEMIKNNSEKQIELLSQTAKLTDRNEKINLYSFFSDISEIKIKMYQTEESIRSSCNKIAEVINHLHGSIQKLTDQEGELYIGETMENIGNIKDYFDGYNFEDIMSQFKEIEEKLEAECSQLQNIQNTVDTLKKYEKALKEINESMKKASDEIWSFNTKYKNYLNEMQKQTEYYVESLQKNYNMLKIIGGKL